MRPAPRPLSRAAEPMSTVTSGGIKSRPRRRGFTQAAYRALDLVIATSALLICLPILLVACLVICLDSPGFPIFSQRRIGRDKRTFTVHKLRTMHAGASGDVHRQYITQLVTGVERAHSIDGQDLYKLVADTRVTRVGRLLRRSSLDELPQLFNVIRGHMSVVGPRPVIPYEVELYPDDYLRRFSVKPGLTGLWQVSGRNERTYHEMVALDITWVERRSIRLYLSIVARTPLVLLQRRGAA